MTRFAVKSCTSISRMKRSKTRVCKKQVVMEHEEGEGAKWVTHYCSDHQILLVGEGDFSFSLCLAKSFGSASNIVASSLDTYDDIIKMYRHAKSNLDELQKLGACLLHGVDATKMKFHSDLKMRRFDRVIFNFPHAGFHGKEDNLLMIKMHQDLVLGFFKNASCMLRANGEIHVNHKTTGPFNNWNIEKLAMQSFLLLIECAEFKKEDYPGYNNKRGGGYKCDKPFPLGLCSTFKFICNPRARNHLRRNPLEVSRQQTYLPFQECQKVEQLPAPVGLNYHPQTSLFPKMNEPVTSVFGLTNRYSSISRDYYFNNVTEIHRRVASSADYYACDMTLHSQRLLQPMESLQSSQPRPTPTNGRYFSLTDPVRRKMDIAPLSLGARNEGYQYQVFGGSSSYLQETAQRSSYCSDRARPDSLTDPLRRTMDIAPLSLGARNEGYQYQVFGGSSSYLQETAQRSSYCSDRARPDSLTDPLRRTMDIAPLSLGARNEGYQYQVFVGSSSYLQETAQRSSYCSDRARPDFERYKYNADVPGRTFNSEIYVQNEVRPMRLLMPEGGMFVG